MPGSLFAVPNLKNPTHCRHYRPQRSGRSAFRHVLDVPRSDPADAVSKPTAGTIYNRPLSRASGGVIFTTIQKFSPASGGAIYPMLSDRRNIVVIADEAHRKPIRLSGTRSSRRPVKSPMASRNIFATPCRTHPSSGSPERLSKRTT